MSTGTLAKRCVLIVEDEPIAREILADLLKMAGYEVVSAHSGEQALLTLVRERGRIDCLFTPVELPGLVDGWMVADEFRGADSGLPIVFASCAETPEAHRGARSVFVGRPALPPEVVEAVNKLTGQSEAAQNSRWSPPRLVTEAAASSPPVRPPHAGRRPRKLRRAAG